MRNKIQRQNGFTLIELMITVAIIGILAAVAYPSYISYVQRGYRSEGIAMLSDAVARVERFFAQNNTYAGATVTGVGFTSATSQSNKYTLTFPTTGATTYVLQVAPIGTQGNDGCGTLTINQAGVRTPDPSTSPNCWK